MLGIPQVCGDELAQVGQPRGEPVTSSIAIVHATSSIAIVHVHVSINACGWYPQTLATVAVAPHQGVLALPKRRWDIAVHSMVRGPGWVERSEAQVCQRFQLHRDHRAHPYIVELHMVGGSVVELSVVHWRVVEARLVPKLG